MKHLGRTQSCAIYWFNIINLQVYFVSHFGRHLNFGSRYKMAAYITISILTLKAKTMELTPVLYLYHQGAKWTLLLNTCPRTINYC